MSESPSAAELREQTSMTNWWPVLKDLDVPTPETVRIPTTTMGVDDGAPATDGTRDAVVADSDVLQDAIRGFDGPPVFLRSDQMSAKHRMDGGSKITTTDPDEFAANIWQLYETQMMAWGVPNPECYYVREWLDLLHEFTAFGGTPIAAELRYFIYEGDVHDHDFYWPADAIHGTDDDEWEHKLKALREHALGAREPATEYASRVSDAFEEYWSVDFALTADGDWYCIDMARGEVSWHPEACERPEGVDE